ncbi:PCMD domain-containing protein [Saccharicrinis aurantiacus]|uniref:PCMD domain-containing protein n=1 Tax=Saccharicrinis aurantiacus TaxID=1849719 RepID=UPI00094F4ACA|nr:PCMD domain-containing protein [Saccharicrinis aurantiacus]
MKKLNIITVIVILFLSACVKEDYFGLSKYGNIKMIEVSNQASQAVINSDSLTATVEIPPGVELSGLIVKTLELSSFAKSDINVGDVIDLSDKVEVNITSEEGSVIKWQIIPYIASATPSLPNGDFSLWYQAAGGYYEPGESESTTIWGTGNAGTQILGLTATTPIELESDNYAAKMETLDNGSLAAAFGTPISAGSIFVGKFDKDAIDPSDPEAAIEFGSPFAGRPKSLKFKYQYTPGTENKDKDGNILPDGDMCDIYAYLEIRTDDIRRLATVWFRDGNEQPNLSELTLDFIYGELPPDTPDYMKPENGLYVENEVVEYILPTHITFVASSSYDGANFSGAVGSMLIIDDVQLIYE